MMRDSGEKKAKVKLETVLELRDGTSILGVFFVTVQAQRCRQGRQVPTAKSAKIAKGRQFRALPLS